MGGCGWDQKQELGEGSGAERGEGAQGGVWEMASWSLAWLALLSIVNVCARASPSISPGLRGPGCDRGARCGGGRVESCNSGTATIPGIPEQLLPVLFPFLLLT